MIKEDEKVAYKLHGFCDPSNQALSCGLFEALNKQTLVCGLCAGQG